MICLASALACTNAPPQPPVVTDDGMMHYKTSRTAQKIACDGRPVSLEGDRTETVLGRTLPLRARRGVAQRHRARYCPWWHD